MSLKIEACLIGGEWRTGPSWIEVDNPATALVIGRVPSLGRPETAEAISAAKAAMPAWNGRTAAQRADVLHRFCALVKSNAQELAALLVEEQGKPHREALAEIDYAAAFISWFAEEGRRNYGETIPSPDPKNRIIVLKQAIGVVGAITPWNFPAAMVTRKIAPALAAGCAVVLKPAEQTPFTALAMAKLAMDAGVPAGLLNVITGKAGEIGSELTSSPDVAKISFTGSTRVGSLLMEQAAPTVKKLSLELGGNAPFIVFDDADIDEAVAGAIRSKFRNAGQTCVCSNRLYVQRGVYEQLVQKLIAATRTLRVGPGTSPLSDVGPVINEAAVGKIEELVADARSKGAQVEIGGARHELGGRFFQPTVLSGVNISMDICQEEIFGPVAPVQVFDDETEAVGLANATPFGLAAYVYTRDLGRAWRVSEALESGIVGLNTGHISTEVAPFGGVKQSGLGREGSRHGLDDYLEMKYICMGLPSR